jgi:hypothetical protein
MATKLGAKNPGGDYLVRYLTERELAEIAAHSARQKEGLNGVRHDILRYSDAFIPFSIP